MSALIWNVFLPIVLGILLLSLVSSLFGLGKHYKVDMNTHNEGDISQLDAEQLSYDMVGGASSPVGTTGSNSSPSPSSSSSSSSYYSSSTSSTSSTGNYKKIASEDMMILKGLVVVCCFWICIGIISSFIW